MEGLLLIKIAHFVLIQLQTWPPQAILVSGWSDGGSVHYVSAYLTHEVS
jgi:cephalosporin-C deacetylase-like acetyl esterase